MLFQRIQNGRGFAVFKAGIKGNVQRFFAGIPHIVGAKWFEILRRGVAHRRLSLLLKAESPIGIVRAGGGQPLAGDRHCQQRHRRNQQRAQNRHLHLPFMKYEHVHKRFPSSLAIYATFVFDMVFFAPIFLF